MQRAREWPDGRPDGRQDARLDRSQDRWLRALIRTPESGSSGDPRRFERASGSASAPEAARKLQPTPCSSTALASATQAQSMAGLIHDARNMVSAIDLYCDLLEEPGVLSPLFRHYASELRMVSGAGRRLLEKLAVAESMSEIELAAHLQAAPTPLSRHLPDFRLAPTDSAAHSASAASLSEALRRDSRRKTLPYGRPVANLAEELLASEHLLVALAGPHIRIDLSISGGQRPIAMTGDDLTRVLVNLTRNAAEAMPCGGDLRIALEEGPEFLSLTFADNGPGIPEGALETIFSPGYSSHAGSQRASDPDADPHVWPVRHRGLGLSIVRSIVSAAGGSIWAANRNGLQPIAAQPTREETANLASPAHAAEARSAVDPIAIQGAVLIIEFSLLSSPVST